ncbi:hypothetical protein BDF14DRAFT_1799084 [Spinellus fusiger]|nr:hypothetical protein BDF14DRAFT_1799084 [Spinellus fusiger]
MSSVLIVCLLEFVSLIVTVFSIVFSCSVVSVFSIVTFLSVLSVFLMMAVSLSVSTCSIAVVSSVGEIDIRWRK